MSGVASPTAFAQLADDALTAIFAFQPGFAQNAGDHRFDGQTGDFSPAGISSHMAEMQRLRDALHAAQPATLEEEGDRLTLLTFLEMQLFNVRDRREPERNPMFYFGRNGIGDVGRYVRRKYAPLDVRFSVLLQHLRAIPEALDQAHGNLAQEVSATQKGVALEEVRRYPEFFERQIPSDLEAEISPEQMRELRRAAAGASEAMRTFASRLAARTAPADEGFALGEQDFRTLLRHRELVDLPAANLLRVAQNDLERNAALLVEAAAEFRPGATVPEVFDAIESDHPTVEGLLPFVQTVLERLRTYLIEHDVVTVPSELRIVPEPTPGHRRAGTAMTDSPGPLETVATDSFYYITFPSPEWSLAQQAAWMRYLNRAGLENLSAHEAYPGHYVHTLHRMNVTSAPRAVLRSQGFGEGWGHYAEEMMMEVGYRQADNPGLHVMQVRDALLRDCRFVAAVSMHCLGMSVDEATRLFQERAYLPEVVARREAVRGTHDVLYVNYTLGKLQIMKLREDYRRRKGSAFNLKTFHDAILDTGAPPVAVVRKLVLGNADDGELL